MQDVTATSSTEESHFDKEMITAESPDSVTQPADPSTRMDQLCIAIQEEHDSIAQMSTSILKRASDAGRYLLELKSLCVRGRFPKIVEAQTTISIRTAQRYIEVHRYYTDDTFFDFCAHNGDLSIAAFLRYAKKRPTEGTTASETSPSAYELASGFAKLHRRITELHRLYSEDLNKSGRTPTEKEFRQQDLLNLFCTISKRVSEELESERAIDSIELLHELVEEHQNPATNSLSAQERSAPSSAIVAEVPRTHQSKTHRGARLAIEKPFRRGF